MTVFSMLYQVFIGPLELFFEVVYAIAHRFLDDPGLAIIALSLAMNFLVLPLYRRADAMQEEERERSVAMKPWVDHIKKTFKGDERFMMLQTYYRQNNFKQTDSLRGSVSLLLEIPFFIAAYHFLSNFESLRGVPFGPIADLGAPDAMIAFGDITVNFLPILMTAINVVSAAIYMKGFPIKSKIQMYGIAAIFLVLLYGSPAGLVFYWTLNNLFSLVKNIFYKLKQPGFVLAVLVSVVGIAGLVFVIGIRPTSTMLRQIAVVSACVLLQVPIIVHFAKKRFGLKVSQCEPSKETDRAFLLACVFLALLTGVLIPSAVIASSALEFVSIAAYKSPIWYIVSSALLAAGTFLLWFGIFYCLATPNAQRVFAVAMWAFTGMAVANYLFFGTGYGNLSPMLQYDSDLLVTYADRFFNLGIVAAVCIVLSIVWLKCQGVVRVLSLAMCLTVAIMSGMNIYSIVSDVAGAKSQIESASSDMATIPLSKTGKNVVVLMMDRAISGYLPAIVHEKPELKDQFDGFTYYPNALSYGTSTNVGEPALWGGYEYTPENMNARADELLGDKTTEALKVMPYLFDDAGYEVTVCDPPYAGYHWIPDLSVYDERPDIHTYITMNGRYPVKGLEEFLDQQSDEARMRNFFCYSIFKISPVMLHPTLYDEGVYNAPRAGLIQVTAGYSKASGVNQGFVESYGVLESLQSMTKISDNSEGTFLMMANDATHQPMLVQEPEYKVALAVDNTEYDAAHEPRYHDDGSSTSVAGEIKMTHYHANMASWLALGEWFDYLRENGVYDNTRIIIVSDHAFDIGLNEQLYLDVSEYDKETPVYALEAFNCMLMVKDFGSTGFTVDESFMTNADTPLMAMEGIIDEPVNPFTGNLMDASLKDEPVQHVISASEWRIDIDNGYTHLPSVWFSVHDDVRVPENWACIGLY